MPGHARCRGQGTLVPIPAMAMTAEAVLNLQSFSQSFFLMTASAVIFFSVEISHHFGEKHGKMKAVYIVSFD